MTDREIYVAIMNHPVLHDVFTHLPDFEDAVTHRRNTSLSQEDAHYWEKQLNTIHAINRFAFKNCKPQA